MERVKKNTFDSTRVKIEGSDQAPMNPKSESDENGRGIPLSKQDEENTKKILEAEYRDAKIR